MAEAALLAALMALPTSMSVAMDRSYEIAKLALLLPLAALALSALASGWTLGQAWPGGVAAAWCRPHRADLAVCGAVGVLALLVVGTALLSDTSALVLYGTHIRREGAMVWLAYFVLLGTAAATLHAPGAMERLLDALLLSSLVPVAYALQQRIGLDFFVTPLADPGRSAGTMGNPNFLAGYLALILPLTLMRARLAWCGARSGALLWGWLAAWQGLALLQTQSRGPLLALVLVLGFVVCLVAARAGARHWLWWSAALMTAGILFLLLINLSPAVARWAGEWPVLNRLIFATHAEVGPGTALAARSVNARLGIWQAATEGIAAAPLAIKLFGYGPDAASMHFLPHVPAQLMTSEGYQQISTFDRTHADMLEIAASFGAVGWIAWLLLFGAVLQTAARALLGRWCARTGIGLALASIAFAGGGAAAAAWAGLAAAAPAAFGLGLALGWMCYVAWHALADMRQRGRVPLDRDWLLLTGLTAALLVAWLDAQINVPVIVTRVATFVLAAAVWVQARRIGQRAGVSGAGPLGEGGQAKPAQPATVLREDAPSTSTGWLAAIGLIAALSSFFGIALDDRVQGPGVGLWFLKVPGIVVFASFAAAVAWIGARYDQVPLGMAMRRFLLWLVLPPALFCVGILVFGAAVEASAAAALPYWVGALSAWPAGMLLLLCVWRASPLGRDKPDSTHASALASARRKGKAGRQALPVPLSGHARSPVYQPAAVRGTLPTFVRLVPAGAVLCLAAWFSWQQIVADVAYNLAEWARRTGRLEIRALFLGMALHKMPHERQYLRPHIFDALESAAIRLPEARSTAALGAVDSDLHRAESWARRALAQYPKDPWLVLALANVRQHQGLSILASAASEGGTPAIVEARQLYARAMLLYPAQPLIYLGLAQLEFDQGNLVAAYQQLDRMEQLIPASPVPYRERILVARAASDQGQIEAALLRASRKLSPEDVAVLRSVAMLQQ